jgi:hypothetical protein
MRLLPIALIIWVLTSTVGFADSNETFMPALGFHIAGESGADILETIIPELARLGFSESLPRELSTEHLPVATFRRLNGDEVRVTSGRQCTVLWFSGAALPPGSDLRTFGHAYGERFSNLQAMLKQYLVRLPQPHPRILETDILPVGVCPE